MKCPYCRHKDTRVLDSRDSDEEDSIRRRRECPKCKKRFTTYERLETSNVIVIKKDGRREQFNRDKLMGGITKACEKRPISRDMIGRAVGEIEMKIAGLGETEIPSKKIGELVMAALKKLDKVAYIRFASVYREFEDVESFPGELKTLVKK